VDNFSNGAISLKFKTIAGDLDRCSGILFNVKPNGDWLSTRYNDTEYNITLWTFHDGIRKMVRRGPGREPWHLARDQWHELKMTVSGTDFKTYIDGQLALEYTLPEPVSGKIGLWSKTEQHQLLQGLRRSAGIVSGEIVTQLSFAAQSVGGASCAANDAHLDRAWLCFSNLARRSIFSRVAPLPVRGQKVAALTPATLYLGE
jgi:hypothetical protein